MVVITSFKPPESPVKLEQDNVTVVLDKKNLGCGKLFISERTLSWQKARNEGFSLDYFHISLHAVSRDPTVYEKDCIYILTDPHISVSVTGEQAPPLPPPSPPPPEENNENDDGNSDDDKSDNYGEIDPDLSELIIVPDNPSNIQSIYESIKVCQELNPDPEDVDDDDEDLYADAEEVLMEEGEHENHFIDANAAINNLADQMQNNVDISYNYSNGDPQNDDEFADAD